MVAYSFRPRFVAPIKVGLGIQVHHEPGDAHVYQPKRQTIRAHGLRRHARPGETLQLYTGMRTRQCMKIGDARCTSVERLVIWTDVMAIMIGGKLLTARQIVAFARSDGFSSVADMHQFWAANHVGVEKFEGVLIKWEPLPA